MDKINVTVAADDSKEPIVLHVLEGKAADPINLSPVSISGRFDAVNNWLAQRAGTFEAKTSFIEVDLEKGTMILKVNEGHPHAKTITATIEKARLLSKLKIETGHRFTNKDLSQVLRVNRILFSDTAAHGELLVKLNKFTAKAQTQLDAIDDSRGNTKQAVETTLESEMPNSFTLNTPVIQGGVKKSFQVNICMEVRDKAISFWLESPEMEEIFMDETKTMLESELKKITDIAIIYK